MNFPDLWITLYTLNIYYKQTKSVWEAEPLDLDSHMTMRCQLLQLMRSLLKSAAAKDNDF